MPQWRLYLDYRKDYAPLLTDMSPSSFANLSAKIHTDPLICKLYKIHSAVGGPGVEAIPCDKEEMQDLYCQTISSDSDELFKCRETKMPFFKKLIDGNKLLNAIVNAINYQWYKPVTSSSKLIIQD